MLVLMLTSSSINFHLEINNPEETSKLEADFAEEVKKRGEDFKYYKDQVFDGSKSKCLLDYFFI